MASIAVTPAAGAGALSPHWTIGGNLAGFHHMAQDIGLTGSVANDFYSITNTVIPLAGNILAFNFYVPGAGPRVGQRPIGAGARSAYGRTSSS